MSDRELLKRLGAGETIDQVAGGEGWDRATFDDWWTGLVTSRLPDSESTLEVGVEAEVRIVRDDRGIPHVLADNDVDLFVGFGLAMAQDRLFQLDYLRRKGLGRLAEILGSDGLEIDLIARTVGLNRIAAAHWEDLPEETRRLTEAFASGINAHIDSLPEEGWPVEFDLLDYRPEPFRGVDLLAIESEFRWYLTGRFPVIVLPDLAQLHAAWQPLLAPPLEFAEH